MDGEKGRRQTGNLKGIQAVKEITAMKFSEHWSRRDMMKTLGMGLVGAATIPVSVQNAFARNPEASLIYRSRGGRSLYQHPEELSSVALVKGNDRAENIYKALKLIEDQVFSGIKASRSSSSRTLCKPATNWPQRTRMPFEAS